MTEQELQSNCHHVSYLGDGLYVGLRIADGTMILWTPRVEGVHWIAVDELIFSEMLAWMKHIE